MIEGLNDLFAKGHHRNHSLVIGGNLSADALAVLIWSLWLETTCRPSKIKHGGLPTRASVLPTQWSHLHGREPYFNAFATINGI